MPHENNLLKVTDSQKKALAIATIASLIAGFLFLRPYIMIIAVAAIVAFLFYPLYEWFCRRGMKSGTAITLTFFATMLSIIIPFTIVLVITVAQISHLVDAANNGSLNINVGELGSSLISSINELFARIGVNYHLTTSGITQALSEAVQKFGTAVLSGIASSITSIFGYITTVILYIFIFYSLLRNRDPIIDTVSALNPLGEKVTDLYLARMGSMTKAMVRGQFIIAIMQGLASAIGLYIAGFQDLFFFFFMFLTIMSVIPLGAGIITIPIGIGLILTGNVWQGVLVILNHLIIVTNIDNVMRPRLVPKDARLDSALTMLSVFGGMALFGFVGIILGPVIMIVIVTTIQMFLEVYRDIDALKREKSGPKRSIWAYIKSKV